LSERTEIIAFLNALFEDVLGFIEVRVIQSDTDKIKRSFTKNVEEAVEFIEKHRDNFNVYVGVATRNSSAHGTKSNLYQLRGFWSDLDFRKPGDEERYKTMLEKFEFPPSMLVNSGHGYQPYWLLEEAEDISNVRRLEGYTLGIANFFGADRCWNLDRVLRVPGTINYPDAKKRRMGLETAKSKLIYLNGRRYNLLDFDPWWEKVEERELAKINIDEIPDKLPGKFLELLETDQKLRATWEGLREDLKDKTRSGYDMALTQRLVYYDFSDNEIAAILRQSPTGKGAEATSRYIALTISKARAGYPPAKSDTPKARETLNITEQDDQLKPDSECNFPSFNIDSCVPKEGLIPDYLDYIAPLTDASPQFKVLTILQAISIIAGNNFWIDWAGQKLFLNLFTLRLGKSTYTRKSHTAWNTNSLTQETLNTDDPAYLLATDCTSEGLVKELAGREEEKYPTTGFIIFSEMGYFLSSTAKGYNQGNEIFLADLFDCKPIYRRLAQKVYSVQQPIVNVIACSTVEWIKEFVTRSMLKGGFWGRFLILPAKMPGKDEINWWAVSGVNQYQYNKIIEQLGEIKKHMPDQSMQFEDGFVENYTNWCKKMYEKYAKSAVFESLDGASARSPFNNLKVASLFELSRNPHAKVVSIESGITANHFMDYILECLQVLIGVEFSGERERRRNIVRSYFLKLKGKEDRLIKRATFQPKFSPYGIDRYQLDEFLVDLASEEIIKIKSTSKYADRTVISEVVVCGEKGNNKN
jgi:hypothetical protein